MTGSAQHPICNKAEWSQERRHIRVGTVTSADAAARRAASVLLPFMLSDWSIMGTWTRSLIYHPIHPNSRPDVLWPLANRARHFANAQSHTVVDRRKTRSKLSCHFLEITHII